MDVNTCGNHGNTTEIPLESSSTLPRASAQSEVTEKGGLSRYMDNPGTDLGGGCRGCAPPLSLEMTFGFLIQLVFYKKKTVWFIDVEVEQETSAPPPKRNPGSAPAIKAPQSKTKGTETLIQKAQLIYKTSDNIHIIHSNNSCIL